MNFSRYIQITKGILFFISNSNLIKLNIMKSSYLTHNIKNWSTALVKMNCLLALTRFKWMFHFYISWEHKKHRLFDCFRRFGNIGLKLVKVMLNNFMNGYLIFVCSYPQVDLYSIGLTYAVNRTWTHNFKIKRQTC